MNQQGLLEVLEQKLETSGIKPGLLVENVGFSTLWTLNVKSGYGLVPVVLDCKNIFLYCGIQTIEPDKILGPKFSFSNDVFLVHSFLLKDKIIYLKVASDTFLTEFIQNFQIPGR